MVLVMEFNEILARLKQDPDFAQRFQNDPRSAVRIMMGPEANEEAVTDMVERICNALGAEEAERSIKDVWRTF